MTKQLSLPKMYVRECDCGRAFRTSRPDLEKCPTCRKAEYDDWKLREGDGGSK